MARSIPEIEEPSAQTGAATSVRSAQNQEPDVRVAIALNLPLSLDSARHRIPEISEELAGHTTKMVCSSADIWVLQSRNF